MVMSAFRRLEGVRIPMRDGVHITADVYLPQGEGPFPALMFRSNSGRMREGRGLSRPFPDFVEAGYAFVICDIRGRGSSEGEWKPEENAKTQGADGYDIVEWIAAQEWCNGNVGLYGLSHAASFEYLAAVEQPPHLKAMAPWTGDYWNIFVPPLAGGVTSFITTIGWLPGNAADTVRRLEQAGEDATAMKEVLEEARANPKSFYEHLPLLDAPVMQFGKLREIVGFRFQPPRQPVLDGLRQYEKVTVPCFHECGWYDPVAWATFHNFMTFPKRGGSELSREGQYMVAGPWQHAMNFNATLGSMNFGQAATTEGSGIVDDLVAFYDKYVKGEDGIELSRVRYFVMGPNQWRKAAAWPLPQTQWQRFYLHSNGSANTAAGDGVMSTDAPSDEGADSFIYDPHRPVPTIGGPLIGNLQGLTVFPGPFEQNSIEARRDVLCYTTAPFSAATEITGPLQVHLFASTSAKDTDFTAKLTHVYEDGRSINLAEGIIRASGRSQGMELDEVVPGEVYEYVITLGHTSIELPAGSRLRLQVSSSNFPQFDRNMNTGNPIGTDATGIRALQTVYHDGQHASYIDLPVIARV